MVLDWDACLPLLSEVNKSVDRLNSHRCFSSTLSSCNLFIKRLLAVRLGYHIMFLTNFKQKTVVITGASAGIGAACARAFAATGANLVLVARGQAALDLIAAELRQHCEVITVAMDIADTLACKTLVQKAIEAFGAIHVLVNNAGLHHRGDVSSRTSEELVAMSNVNFRAPVQLTAETLPYLLQQGHGAIVMVGSLAGRAPLKGAAAYAGTKAGLRAFTLSLADELQGSNVAVGLVAPGPVDTGFIMDAIDDVEDVVYSQPMSSAEQVAEAVLAVARGEKVEINLPWLSGKLSMLNYLSPWLRRRTRGMLDRMGRKNKEKYRRRT